MYTVYSSLIIEWENKQKKKDEKIKIFSRNSHSNNYLKNRKLHIPNKRRKRKATQILSPKTKNQKKIYLLLLYITTKKKRQCLKQTIIESKFSKKKTLLTKNNQTVDEFKTKEKKAPKKYQLTQLHYILLHIYIYQSIKKSNLGVSKLVIHHIFVLFL